MAAEYYENYPLALESSTWVPVVAKSVWFNGTVVA